MKFRKPLDDIFQTPSSVRVLRVLVHSELDLTGRQIADMAGLNPQTCQNTLDRLNDLHLLATRRVGRAYLYRLRTNNIIVMQMLRPLFVTEKSLLSSELSKVAARYEGTAIAVVLFGSVARGEEEPGSDIDLCVIVKNPESMEAAREKGDEILDHLADATGIVPTIIVWSKDEFLERYNRGDGLARSLLEEGRSIMGPPVYEVLRDVVEET
jgi:predicted nucleotidyltransferase